MKDGPTTTRAIRPLRTSPQRGPTAHPEIGSGDRHRRADHRRLGARRAKRAGGEGALEPPSGPSRHDRQKDRSYRLREFRPGFHSAPMVARPVDIDSAEVVLKR